MRAPALTLARIQRYRAHYGPCIDSLSLVSFSSQCTIILLLFGIHNLCSGGCSSYCCFVVIAAAAAASAAIVGFFFSFILFVVEVYLF